MSGKLLKRAPLLILAVFLLLTGCQMEWILPPVLSRVDGPFGVIPFTNATFIWSGHDVDGDVLWYEYRKDNSSWVDLDTLTCYTWTDYVEGIHTFAVRAHDSSGSYSEALLWIFFYDDEGLIYPRKPVTVICPWGAGGGSDRITRFVSDILSTRLEEAFNVVNRTGGGGAVGHSAGVSAAPDGYTLSLITTEICTIHWLGLSTFTYEDFDYLIQLNEDNAGVIVHASAPWNSINELLDYIKANPNELIFSGSGSGSMWDLARIGLLNAAGLDIDSVMWFPTTGAAASIIELLEDGVDVITCSVTEAGAQLKSGQLKLLAVMSDERLPDFPSVPTLKEESINWTAGTWRGLAVPNNAPEEIKTILEAEILYLASSEEFEDFMDSNGFAIKIRSSDEFRDFAEQQDMILGEVLELGGFIN
ncbi:MAG TPA: tripartite tricarboxylate transporter substrate binding protein [Mesotoga infera]|nr:tripartite tricarboxylate transporter substrate binding protein [Mesotoga infera]HRV02673.1 tripartite tricarboxylate transporter substrate binding protein [Mesotoga sp.]